MYLLDSNILIYHLNGEGAITSFIKGEMPKFISVISVTELLAKPSITLEQEFLITNFLEQFRMLPLDVLVAKKAAEFKRKYNLTFPDAIMAATAERYNLILITRDKGFKKVSEMRTLAL